MKVYTYKNCSTCREAVKWLRQSGLNFEELPIRETPPSLDELRSMLTARGGDVRALCNTSGQDYRALNLKEKLTAMPVEEVLQLLASNGNLIKRPFAIDPQHEVYLTGFREVEWEERLR